jgi:hypothetical protein
MATNQLINRTISRAHYDRLTDAMRSAADSWGWRVVDSPTPNDPSLITLQDLGLEPYIAPPLQSEPSRAVPARRAPQQVDSERLPTLEEYVNAGYPVHQYSHFIERETEYRRQRLAQAEALKRNK